VHSIRVNDGLASRWHLTELLSQVGGWQSLPSSLHSLSELIPTYESVVKMILNPILHPIPHLFNWVQVWRKRGPFNTLNASFTELLHSLRSCINRRRILHKNKLKPSVSIKLKLTLNKRDNSLLISFCINRLLFFLLKDIRPFDILMKATLKHPSFALLIAFNNASRVSFFISLTYNIRLGMPIPIYLSLITPKYPLSIFICPIEMLNSPLKLSESITLNNRGFLMCNLMRKPCVLKGISDAIVAHIKPHCDRDLIS
jgi:hypothetical protein